MYTNKEKDQSGDSTEISESEDSQVVTIKSMLKDPNYTMAAMAGCMGYFQYDYLGPILAPRLAELSLNQTQIGLFFTICAIVYIATCFSLPWTASRINKRTVIITGLLASCPVNLFMGPSVLFRLPANSLWLIGFGQALLGLFDPFILVFCLPEMIDLVEKKHPNLSKKEKARLADVTSSLLTFVLGIGQIAGPIFSAIFAQRYGFRLTCDVVAIACFCLGMVYLSF